MPWHVEVNVDTQACGSILMTASSQNAHGAAQRWILHLRVLLLLVIQTLRVCRVTLKELFTGLVLLGDF